MLTVNALAAGVGACVVVAFVAVAAPPAHAQRQVTITVKVLRQSDGAPVANTQVCLGNGDTSNANNFAAYGNKNTNSSGVAVFENVTISTYWTYATAVKSGYISRREQFNPGAATTAEVIIRMTEGSGGYGCPVPAPSTGTNPSLTGPINLAGGAPTSSGLGPAPGEGQAKLIVTVTNAATRAPLAGAQVCIGSSGSALADYASAKSTDSDGRAWFIVADVRDRYSPNLSKWGITAGKTAFTGRRVEFFWDLQRNGRTATAATALSSGSGGATCPPTRRQSVF